MLNKNSATLSGILTIVVLILLAIVSLLLQLVALNGASERQGVTAMGISLACQGIVAILLGILAARATNFLITKVNWNNILAIVVTVLVATMVGGTLSFLSSVIAIPVAGVR